MCNDEDILERASVRDIEELCSRIDEGLTSLDQGKGTDGEKFMQGLLSDLDSLEAKTESLR